MSAKRHHGNATSGAEPQMSADELTPLRITTTVVMTALIQDDFGQDDIQLGDA